MPIGWRRPVGGDVQSRLVEVVTWGLVPIRCLARDGGSRPGSGAAGGRHSGAVRSAATVSGGVWRSGVGVGALGAGPASEEARDHLLGGVGEALLGLLEIGVPDRAVPDLEA